MDGSVLQEERCPDARSGKALNYLTPDHVLLLHQEAVERYGGSHGLRDRGLLESAIYRCRATFGGSDLYPDVWTKAAALLHGLLKNHAFVDGNKRTAYTSAARFMHLNGHELQATREEAKSFLLDVEANRLNVDQMAAWLESRSKGDPQALRK